MITATLYTDPGCPWAYSENPALRVIEWRYGDQIDWKLVLIGLTERSEQYVARGYTPLRGALGQLRFRRYGMPFAPEPKPRVSATARACRAVIAARLQQPGSEWAVFRALQLANFTSSLVLEDDDGLRAVIATIPGVDADAIVAALDSDAVTAAYEADKASSRTAAGSATELQGKAGNTDGQVRYTAPSVIFESNGHASGGRWLSAGRGVRRARRQPRPDARAVRRRPRRPEPLLDRFPTGLTTQEVAALMTHGNDAVDRPAAEAALIELVFAGKASRVALGDDALWVRAGGVQADPRELAGAGASV